MSDHFLGGPAPDFSPTLTQELKALCPSVFLVAYRDKNRNVVVYEANLTSSGELSDPPVLGYWLMLEPSYREARRKRGLAHDREEFTMLEKRYAYGFESVRKSPATATFKFVMHDQVFGVKVVNGRACLYGRLNGVMYQLSSLFIRATENVGMFNLLSNVKKLVVTGKRSGSDTLEQVQMV